MEMGIPVLLLYLCSHSSHNWLPYPLSSLLFVPAYTRLVVAVAFSFRFTAAITSLKAVKVKLFYILCCATRFTYSFFHLTILKSLVFRHG